MTEKYLVKQGKGYAFRIAVPVDIRHKFETRNVTVGLGTDSLVAARKARDRYLVEYQGRFDRARRSTEMTVQEAEEEALKVYRGLLAQMAKDRPSANAVKQDHLAAQLDYIDANEPHEIALVTARIEAFRGRLRMMHGKPSRQPVSFSGEIDPLTLQPVGPRASNSGAMRFLAAMDLLVAEQTRDPGAAPRGSTLYMHAKIYRMFAAHAGNPPIDGVTRAMAADFLAAVGEERKLSNRSLRQYSSTLSAAFKWLIKTGRFDGANPFAGQTYKAPRETGQIAFSSDQLKTLFAFDKPATVLQWVMLIGLYSGLRLNEICQLRVADLHKEGDIWIFDVREGDGQILKTAAARRWVPVHGQLIAAGLLDYREGIGKGPLFPSLKGYGPDGKRSWYVSQMFTDYRRSCGIEQGRRLVFHSLRKNFTSALDRAGVPLADAAALLGHSRGFSWDVYSSGPGLQRLQELVERVEYEGLRLDHLHV